MNLCSQICGGEVTDSLKPLFVSTMCHRFHESISSAIANEETIPFVFSGIGSIH